MAAAAAASSHSLPPTSITSLLLLLIISLPLTILSQDPSTSILSTIADCGPRLLPLASCAPFVQGSVQTPVQPCCDNLKQLYDQQPDCLCILLNDTTVSSLPINTTLALQLPILCSLQLDISTCSGMSVPPTPPTSQVSLGSNSNSTNSTVAASPTVAVAPRPNLLGFGFGRSAGMKLKTGGNTAMVAVAAAIVTAVLLTKVQHCV